MDVDSLSGPGVGAWLKDRLKTWKISELAERKIAFTTKVSSGSLHRLSIDVAWVLDGLHKLACVPDVGCPQVVSNQISMLARRVHWGASGLSAFLSV
jgi:hypothetical protein